MAREETCVNHPDVPAETRCRQCHKPICKACIKSDSNGQFCSFQCSEKFKDFQAREQGSSAKKGGMMRKVIVLVVILAVLVFVGAKFFHIGICESILKMVGLG